MLSSDLVCRQELQEGQGQCLEQGRYLELEECQCLDLGQVWYQEQGLEVTDLLTYEQITINVK